MRFNINHKVRVKLTDAGRELVRKRHDEIFKDWPNPKMREFEPIKEDADGWSEWQLWNLMADFGPHLYNGCKVPFETEIDVIENQE